MTTRKPIFMIHKHQATHLHYDLRLEVNGKLASWALREIPLKPNTPVLAIKVPDHPFWYRHFEGVIPEGEYGAGPVMVWEKGLYKNFTNDHTGNYVSTVQAIERGIIMIWLEGHKLHGGYLLVRISKKQRWLFIKINDELVHKGRLPKAWNLSVKSGKSLEDILKNQHKKSP